LRSQATKKLIPQGIGQKHTQTSDKVTHELPKAEFLSKTCPKIGDAPATMSKSN
jgi:hypothetical protein